MREHAPFLIIATALTLATTWPTLHYALQPDVFWLPTGKSSDVYIHLWDTWYGKQFLSGQADRYYTNLMFYPEGVSLTHHQFAIPYQILVNTLMWVGGVSNAFCLAFLLIIWFSAFSAYLYLRWLFSDRWTATVGAVVFGFSPHIVSHPNHPTVALVFTIPLILYGFHRGLVEKRSLLIVAAGLLTGLTTVTNLYAYVCAVITLALAICGFALKKWRDKDFWIAVALLFAVAAISSAWRLGPILLDSQGLSEAMDFYQGGPAAFDVIQVMFNLGGPVIGAGLASVFQLAEIPRSVPPIYLGLLPFSLIALGLRRPASRRKMMPWILLYAVFLILSLGDFLKVAGIEFRHILLPKHFLDEIIPFVFRTFASTGLLISGALFPAAVLVCFGVAALRKAWPGRKGAAVVLMLIALIGLDYHFPVQGNLIPRAQFNFIDWLATDGSIDKIRLVNLPMGHKNSKRYNLYQLLSGYPHAEGAISRTPNRARDYIRANAILDTWYRKRPIICNAETREVYLAALAELESDGFSHVLFHQNVGNRLVVVDSFVNAQPSYRDDFVWIYRMSDLRRSCDH